MALLACLIDRASSRTGATLDPQCVKFQSVVAPDGLILDMFGRIEGLRHDCYLLAKSNLINCMREKHLEWRNPEFCLFADKGYFITPEIQTPFKGPGQRTPEQIQFSKYMSRIRLAVKYGFGKISQQFAMGNYSRNQNIYWQQVSRCYPVSMILTNCLTCLYGLVLVQDRFRIKDFQHAFALPRQWTFPEQCLFSSCRFCCLLSGHILRGSGFSWSMHLVYLL